MELHVPIQIRRDLAANMPAAMLAGELFFQTDTHNLYCGTGVGVVEVGGGGGVTSFNSRTGEVEPEDDDYSSFYDASGAAAAALTAAETYANSLAVNYDASGAAAAAQAAAEAASVSLSLMTTLGDILYENATPTAARLAGNTSSTKQFLTQTGTGSASAAPSWGTIASGDVPTLNQNTSGTAGGLSGTPNISVTNLTVGGTTSFGAGSIAVAALAADTIALTDSTGLFTIAGSPATLGSGLTLSAFAAQTANTVLRAGSGTPTFSALVVGDLPTTGTWAFAGTLSGALTFTGNIQLASGTYLDWNADTYFSRLSSGVLALGTSGGGLQGTIVAASEAIASQIAGTLGTQLATPSTPTITFVGSTSGSPTWSYKLVAYDQFGFETLPSTAGTITSSNTTLSSSNYNVITAPSTLPLGCVGWNVYRTAVATSPTTTGIIGQITTAGGTLNDKALPGDGSTVPLWNFTGLITSAASAGAGSCGLLTPFHEAALMSADTTVVFVGNSTINQLKAIQCYCARTVTVNRMTLDVVQNEAGQTANIAIYRGDGGRKLFDVNVSVASTGIVTSTSTGVTGFSFPFTFYAGQTYYIVSSSSNASASAYGVTLNGYATIQQNLVSAVHVRYGYCANLTSGGVAPATLGTITYQGASSFPIACYWEP